MKKYNFTVVGSGTAGWLTALFLLRNYPFAKVTVIASSDIGIIGAGEGTTPHFVSFLNQLDIPVLDVIRYAKGTFKNGITFTNWNGDGHSYFHPFHDGQELNCFNNGLTDDSRISSIVLDEMINSNNIDNCILGDRATKLGLTKLKPNLSLSDSILNNYHGIGTFSLHFDATLLAKYLKRIAISRRIKYIDDEVDEILTDEEGYITGLKTINKDVYETNFVFDCTGFKRKIIGGHFKAPWKSYKESLPVNRAIPFFIQHDDENIKPHTEAIAMKYGWVWHIPVEGRYGCGYVFDDKHTTEEQVKQEILDMFGENVEFGAKTFTFEAGRYETPWVKNCIAVGLSAGFIEPLEATSIMTSIFTLSTFIPNTLGNITRNPFYVDRFNKKVTEYQDYTLDFIYLHYVTKRTDTEFWSKFTENNKMPEKVKKFIDECQQTIPDDEFINSINSVYNIASYHSVGRGLRIIKRDKAQEMYRAIISDARREAIFRDINSFHMNLEVNLPTLVHHSTLLKVLRER